ncbi:MAG: hypothetical protein Q8O76_00820, partial [Chloroflexota bacterium]|nr:hypothetical protein [Chloroflexota bacterium]
MKARRDKSALIIVALAMALLYLAGMLRHCRGNPCVPLDDSFIYFQYARQAAQGNPWQYNAGDEPSTGATSYLYLAILAAGYKVGFTGERIIFFTFGLNTVFLSLSALIVYRVTLLLAGDAPGVWGQQPQSATAPRLQAGVAGLLLLFNGSLLWGYFSGLEIGLFTTIILATLYASISKPLWMATIFACLMALCRPEGLVLAIFWGVVMGL